MSSLKERLIKNSTIELTASLEKSKVYGKKDVVQTPVPLINVGLSSRIDGGLSSGLTCIAGPSRHFKTGFSLLIAKAYLDTHPEAIILFYDSEFGAPQGYFAANGIDPKRVVHTPIKNIEELKHDIVNQIEQITREDKVIIVIDSLGNLASIKEVKDALSGNEAADLTRARQMKSLFRIVTPYLSLNDIPMIAVMHTYKTLELYSKDVMSGGTGAMLAADTVWILGRAQEKDAEGISGYHFTINIEKSRFVKEKSKLPITVSYEKGIIKYSGLLELALEAGIVIKPKNGWYRRADAEEGSKWSPNMRADAINNSSEFWLDVFKTTNFSEWIHEKFAIPENLQHDNTDEAKEVFDIDDEE
jgi:hypothetical protein